NRSVPRNSPLMLVATELASYGMQELTSGWPGLGVQVRPVGQVPSHTSSVHGAPGASHTMPHMRRFSPPPCGITLTKHPASPCPLCTSVHAGSTMPAVVHSRVQMPIPPCEKATQVGTSAGQSGAAGSQTCPSRLVLASGTGWPPASAAPPPPASTPPPPPPPPPSSSSPPQAARVRAAKRARIGRAVRARMGGLLKRGQDSHLV